MAQEKEIQSEKERLLSKFSGADENKLQAMDALIEQAAYETVYLKELNEIAKVTGLVRVNVKNPVMQESLPISKTIATHSATLTNILDKLCRNLCVESEEEDEGLSSYE